MPLPNRKGNQNRNFGQNNANKGQRFAPHQAGTSQRFTTNQGGLRTGQRIRLRRYVNQDEIIQQNINRMKNSIHKKRLAQEKYYQQQGNRSPLLRTTNKTSIHSRLGVGECSTSQNFAHKPFNARNKNAGNPGNQGGNRIRLRRQILQPEQIIKNNIIRKKNEGVKRLQHSAQQRILRIRQNNTNNQNYNNNPAQKVRLRRRKAGGGGPVNYTVQVANNTNNREREQPLRHSLNACLTQKYQEEIRLIQNKNIHHDEIPPIPIHPHGTGFTGTTLNERFSQL